MRIFTFRIACGLSTLAEGHVCAQHPDAAKRLLADLHPEWRELDENDRLAQAFGHLNLDLGVLVTLDEVRPPGNAAAGQSHIRLDDPGVCILEPTVVIGERLYGAR